MNRSSMPKQMAEHSMTVAEEREEAISQLFETTGPGSLASAAARTTGHVAACLRARRRAMLTATLRVEERSLRRKALDGLPELLTRAFRRTCALRQPHIPQAAKYPQHPRAHP
jgi:hypothetical protein